jgi:hypothetical protein
VAAQLDQSAAAYTCTEIWPEPKAGESVAKARESKSKATAKRASLRLVRPVTDRSSLAEDERLSYKRSGRQATAVRKIIDEHPRFMKEME